MQYIDLAKCPDFWNQKINCVFLIAAGLFFKKRNNLNASFLCSVVKQKTVSVKYKYYSHLTTRYLGRTAGIFFLYSSRWKSMCCGVGFFAFFF